MEPEAGGNSWHYLQQSLGSALKNTLCKSLNTHRTPELEECQAWSTLLLCPHYHEQLCFGLLPFTKFNLYVEREWRQGTATASEGSSSLAFHLQSLADNTQQSSELHLQLLGSGDTEWAIWHWPSILPRCNPPSTRHTLSFIDPTPSTKPGLAPIPSALGMEGAPIVHHCSDFQLFPPPAFLTFKSPIDLKAACPRLASCKDTFSQNRKKKQEQRFCSQRCITPHIRVISVHFGRSSSWKEGQMEQNRLGCCWNHLLKTSHCPCRFSSLGLLVGVFSPPPPPRLLLIYSFFKVCGICVILQSGIRED